ncbi:MAG: helicase [Candidatus Saccharibacteria bacterium]|nr:helicase [Candidatus Saccharibacteria bacterium]
MRQKQALAVMMSGANVFLTGAPGAGKTYVLNQFIKRAERAGKRVAVTASTGIAASHLGGTTIHSWSGLGIIDYLSPEDLERFGTADRLIKRYNSVDVLVIDEVSMLHGQRLNMVNQLAKILRGSELPFGGMQVVLVGDLFQLPPVSRGQGPVDFVHLSEAWSDLSPQICYITEQHRQQGSDQLLEFLEAMRNDDVNEDRGEVITNRIGMVPGEDEVVTRLYSHNVDVETINQKHLAAIPDRSRTYAMQTKGSKAKIEQLFKGLLTPETLELKVGAEVMFVANNFGEGFVNGSRGRVIAFDKASNPIVRLTNNRLITVEPHSWSLNEDGLTRAEVTQLPLRLAWAITIHKSQGMSLDAAEIDLSRAFTPGMGYVALSRVRSIDGLYLKGLNNMAMNMHPAVHEFDVYLRQDSEQLSSITDDVEDEAAAAPKATPNLDEELLEKLKRWRIQRATADKVAAYMIAHNAALEAVATVAPTTKQQLLGIPGFGPKKVDSYGDDILKIVAQHTS